MALKIIKSGGAGIPALPLYNILVGNAEGKAEAKSLAGAGTGVLTVAPDGSMLRSDFTKVNQVLEIVTTVKNLADLTQQYPGAKAGQEVHAPGFIYRKRATDWISIPATIVT